MTSLLRTEVTTDHWPVLVTAVLWKMCKQRLHTLVDLTLSTSTCQDSASIPRTFLLFAEGLSAHLANLAVTLQSDNFNDRGRSQAYWRSFVSIPRNVGLFISSLWVLHRKTAETDDLISLSSFPLSRNNRSSSGVRLLVSSSLGNVNKPFQPFGAGSWCTCLC